MKKRQVYKLVEQNKLLQAIAMMIKYADAETKQELALCKARLNDLEKQHRGGLMEDHQADVGRARVRKQLLTIVDEMDGSNPSPNFPSEPRNPLILVISIIVVGSLAVYGLIESGLLSSGPSKNTIVNRPDSLNSDSIPNQLGDNMQPGDDSTPIPTNQSTNSKGVKDKAGKGVITPRSIPRVVVSGIPKNSASTIEFVVLAINDSQTINHGFGGEVSKILVEKGYTSRGSALNQDFVRLGYFKAACSGNSAKIARLNLDQYFDYLCLATLSFSRTVISDWGNTTSSKVKIRFAFINADDGSIELEFSEIATRMDADQDVADQDAIELALKQFQDREIQL